MLSSNDVKIMNRFIDQPDFKPPYVVYRLDWRHLGGKVYIGSTSRWPKRYYEHVEKGGLGFNLGNPIVSIRSRHLSREVAYKREVKTIAQWWPNCYNQRRGR